MSRAHTSQSPVGVRSWAIRLLAAVVVLVAVLCTGTRGEASVRQLAQHSGPSIHAGSRQCLEDAVLRRAEPQFKRDRVRFDGALRPLVLSQTPLRYPATHGAVRALGAGSDAPRDLRISHFRRRIPRMNSEEPPCG